MTTFIKIALRNIARNKIRSVITLAAVSAGLGALIFLNAFVDGGNAQMINNYTDLVTSHIQIHKKGFHKNMGLDKSISNPGKIESALQSAAGVKTYTRRIKEFVLISSRKKSSGILLVGINPEREKKVTTMHKRVKGEFLNQDNQIILGKDLFDILEVTKKDEIVIMTQAADGSLAADKFVVAGSLTTGAGETDRTIALITLNKAKELLVMPDKISEFAIRTDNVYGVDNTAGNLRHTINNPDYEILTWKEIDPLVLQWIEFNQTFVFVIMLVVLLVAIIGILNTLLMGILERIREFGVMLSLGTKRSQIMLIVSLESFFLGLTGAILGIIIGFCVTLYFGRYGIDLSHVGEAFKEFYVGTVIYPRIFWNNILVSSLSIFIISLLAGLIPAWKAANLKPTEAIHHI